MIRLGLDSIRYLCEKMNNPQDRLEFIHIAGTNGKGSTGAFISSVLREAGLRVGVFSSPAVFSREETICVGRRAISRKDYDEGMSYIDGLCDEILKDKDIPVTPFERETALAFWYFEKKACDIVVLECGMGGRTDATNIVKNTLVSVFTPISLDHTDYLGKTLGEIASVKAGIIKDGAAVVSAPCCEEVEKALRSEAEKYGTVVDIIQPRRFKKNELGIRGVNQNENASVAVAAIRALIRNEAFAKKFSITDSHIAKGLHNTRIKGRFELISQKPAIVLDGGHNPAAAKCLYENLTAFYPNRKIVLVVGMLVNKDHKDYLRTLLPLASMVLTVSTEGERGYSAEDLAREALEVTEDEGWDSSKISAVGGVEEAVEIAGMLAEKTGVIVVCGSFTILKCVSGDGSL